MPGSHIGGKDEKAPPPHKTKCQPNCSYDEPMKAKFSHISILHYVKLVYRSLLFLVATACYVFRTIEAIAYRFPTVLVVIWAVFFVEMLLRFFPSRLESMGCQKQFARNYKERGGGDKPELLSPKRTFAVAAAWLLFNAVFGALYRFGVLDREILLLLCLFYSVCDMVCILFFCPFQTWFMKNKCCVSCRIYNWDYAMMFTPLVFIGNGYAWSLLAPSLILLAKWELVYHLHPERFSEKTNACLSCANCSEKLCSHKKQLRSFLQSQYSGIYSTLRIHERKGK